MRAYEETGGHGPAGRCETRRLRNVLSSPRDSSRATEDTPRRHLVVVVHNAYVHRAVVVTHRFTRRRVRSRTLTETRRRVLFRDDFIAFPLSRFLLVFPSASVVFATRVGLSRYKSTTAVNRNFSKTCSRRVYTHTTITTACRDSHCFNETYKRKNIRFSPLVIDTRFYLNFYCEKIDF